MIRVATLALLLATATHAAPSEMGRWQAQARRVTIVRDDWGIPHITGKTDADAVFGMIYAQAEDDFPRVETNFINAMGRLAETEGESAIWRDLRMKLFIDPAELQAQYAASPAWLQTLCTAWADALNFYLATHPAVKPRVISRFEPWMALSFSEGSIGGDIESIDLKALAAFYTGQPQRSATVAELWPEPSGSNGFAIAPSKSADGRALLLINPHTSFYFRSEAQVTSGEGLATYGASTWGQFFTYQGFNRQIGWMHTTSGVDRIDEFALTVERRDGRMMYRFGGEWLPLAETSIEVPYRAADGSRQVRRFTAWRSRHGPVIRAENGKWIAVALMHKPVAALEQSYLRTKASDLKSFLAVSERKANSSNNTIFASSKGEIAYLHPQFVARRDNRFDWTRPVDGSDPAAQWQGEHALGELPMVVTPASGWVMNVNNWPWTAAGPDSPKRDAFPRYMDQAGENPRGPNAVRLLSAAQKFTPDTLIAAAYDPYLTAFAELIPTLTRAWDALPAGARKEALSGPVRELKAWDYRTSEASVPMTLASVWGDALVERFGAAARQDDEALIPFLVEKPTPEDRLAALESAVARLTREFGRWDLPWGEINRFQRLTANPAQIYDDGLPSTPIGFASAQWGSLASFGSRPRTGTKRWYGDYGNSFVAVVAFGPQGPEARAVMTGGQSGNPMSRHFRDQAERYRRHQLRPVYLTPEALKDHTERTYRPGE